MQQQQQTNQDKLKNNNGKGIATSTSQKQSTKPNTADLSNTIKIQSQTTRRGSKPESGKCGACS